MIKYPKIKTLFERDKKTFKVNKEIYTDNFANHITDFYFQEKIDGMNVQIDPSSLTFNGRTEKAHFTPDQKEFLNKLANRLKSFFDSKEYIFFGELYGEKIQGNLYKKEGLHFCLFDIYLKDKGCFMTQFELDELIYKTPFEPLLPKVCLCSPNVSLRFATLDFFKKLKSKHETIPKSFYENYFEGIIIRTGRDLYNIHRERIIYKLKLKDFPIEI